MNLWKSKGYGAQQLYQDLNWKQSGIKKFWKKLRETGSLDHLMGSGRHAHRAAVTTFLL